MYPVGMDGLYQANLPTFTSISGADILKRYRMLKIGAAIAGLLLPGAAWAGGPPALYTAAQATAGAGVFVQDCAMCHGADLKGGAGPGLIGQGFAAPGADATVGSVFGMVAQQMPATAPGSLSQAQDEDVMAYILQRNGYPAGSVALAYKDSMGSAVPLVSLVK
jgi:mono/diheme cytochrome c family protein